MNRLSFISTITILVIMGVTMFFLWLAIPKIGWISLNEVYEKFEYKIQLEKELTLVQQQRKFLLDSMAFETKLLSQQGKKEEASIAYRSLQLKQEQFEEENAAITEKYQQQILKQLNQYVNDYSKEKGYDLILSASGDGSLMAAKPEINITQDMVLYINSKYKGK